MVLRNKCPINPRLLPNENSSILPASREQLRQNNVESWFYGPQIYDPPLEELQERERECRLVLVCLSFKEMLKEDSGAFSQRKEKGPVVERKRMHEGI